MASFETTRRRAKVELHVHLDGAFDEDILFAASKEKIDSLPMFSTLPWDQTQLPIRSQVAGCSCARDFRGLATCKGKRSLHEMIKCFELFLPAVRGDLVLLEELAFRFVEQQVAQDVVYTEVRYNPHLLSSEGSIDVSATSASGENEPAPGSTEKVGPVAVVEAVTRGLRRGSLQNDVTVNQILCCIQWRPDWAREVVDIAAARSQDWPCAVVGVDIAAGEEHFDGAGYPALHQPHLTAMQRAKELGLNVTLHAGEDTRAANIRAAVDAYGASRVGHGYRLLEDAVLTEEMVERGVHFECCPTSSFETGGWTGPGSGMPTSPSEQVPGDGWGVSSSSDRDVSQCIDWTQHPMRAMIEAGVRVGINSDDPQVFATSLNEEFEIVLTKMGLTEGQLKEATEAAIDAAFIDEASKSALRQRISALELRWDAELRNTGNA